MEYPDPYYVAAEAEYNAELAREVSSPDFDVPTLDELRSRHQLERRARRTWLRRPRPACRGALGKRLVKAKAQEALDPANPGLAQARPRHRESVVDVEVSGMLPLVDALAVLAADLWFAGKLDQYPLEEEFIDVEDE
jgi:hypothetical protein